MKGIVIGTSFDMTTPSNYAAEQITYSGTVITGGAEVQKVIDGANLVKTRGLSQIPNNQITLSNGVLQQNRGW